MKVLENLENYEIPSQFRLTNSEEEELAKDLADIVNALIPIRTSKLKTRQYFNSHLRYTSNEKDFKASVQNDDLPFPVVDEYKALPGEYLWDSDLLQPTLLDIIKPSEFQFGFVYNLIQEDIAYRRNQHVMKGVKISDGLVKFANQFDIDEIRKTAKEIPDIAERILFLNKVRTDYMVFDELSRDEEEWVGSDIGHSIDSLKEEAENELKILQQTGALRHHTRQNIERKATSGEPRADRFDASRGMLYDFAVSQNEKFKPLAITMPEKWDSGSSRNKRIFEAFIDRYFETCYDDRGGLIQNEATFRLTPLLLVAMMDSYETSLKNSRGYSERMMIRKMSDWVLETNALITRAYENHPTLFSEQMTSPIEDAIEQPSVKTDGFYRLLIETIYSRLSLCFEDYEPSLPEVAERMVPYNFWKDDFEHLQREFGNKFGLEPEQKALVFKKENIEHMRLYLIAGATDYANEISMDSVFGSSQDRPLKTKQNITGFLYQLFRDYLSRVQAVSSVKEDVDSSVIAWLTAFEKLVVTCYNAEHQTIANNSGTRFSGIPDIHYFFFDVYAKTLLEMTTGYFADYDRMELMPASESSGKEQTIQAGTPQEDDTPVKENPELKPVRHNKDINYEELYNHWNTNAFDDTTIEEFTYAMDYADFSTVIKKSKDKGPKKGYIGAIKYIIKNLQYELGQQWFRDACASVGETTDGIGSSTTTSKAIENTDTAIIKKCIKNKIG